MARSRASPAWPDTRAWSATRCTAFPTSARKTVPWQRVINAQGRISLRAFAGSEAVQRRLLEREGVRFDARARIDLERFGWQPRAEKRAGTSR